MSQAQAAQFFAEHVAGKVDAEALDLEALERRANELGYTVTAEELVRAAQLALSDLAASRTDIELDDDMLATVAGGLDTAGSFQNMDQKKHQLYDIMSKVMRAMHEMGMGSRRNML
ncbi:MAG: hypothetical protein KC503_03255 [Myxococcales bacterium]|nr:hypothetical protein [Myxococcales bacterium]